jgi:hypothetical protein
MNLLPLALAHYLRQHVCWEENDHDSDHRGDRQEGVEDGRARGLKHWSHRLPKPEGQDQCPMLLELQ